MRSVGPLDNEKIQLQIWEDKELRELSKINSNFL